MSERKFMQLVDDKWHCYICDRSLNVSTTLLPGLTVVALHAAAHLRDEFDKEDKDSELLHGLLSLVLETLGK
ncbi:MAG: hypothetical protein ACXACT_16860 [Candidatus Thorarchaeota archaeon]